MNYKLKAHEKKCKGIIAILSLMRECIGFIYSLYNLWTLLNFKVPGSYTVSRFKEILSNLCYSAFGYIVGTVS